MWNSVVFPTNLWFRLYVCAQKRFGLCKKHFGRHSPQNVHNHVKLETTQVSTDSSMAWTSIVQPNNALFHSIPKVRVSSWVHLPSCSPTLPSSPRPSPGPESWRVPQVCLVLALGSWISPTACCGPSHPACPASPPVTLGEVQTLSPLAVSTSICLTNKLLFESDHRHRHLQK